MRRWLASVKADPTNATLYSVDGNGRRTYWQPPDRWRAFAARWRLLHGSRLDAKHATNVRLRSRPFFVYVRSKAIVADEKPDSRLDARSRSHDIYTAHDGRERSI